MQFDKLARIPGHNGLRKKDDDGTSGAPASPSVAGWPSQLIKNIGAAAPHLYPRITAACEKWTAAITSSDEPLRDEATSEMATVMAEGLPLLLVKNAPRFSGRNAMVDLFAHRAGRTDGR